MVLESNGYGVTVIMMTRESRMVLLREGREEPASVSRRQIPSFPRWTCTCNDDDDDDDDDDDNDNDDDDDGDDDDDSAMTV